MTQAHDREAIIIFESIGRHSYQFIVDMAFDHASGHLFGDMRASNAMHVSIVAEISAARHLDTENAEHVMDSLMTLIWAEIDDETEGK